ncbi:conserved exported hypothetical protein [Bosea sp. 62]|uniref:hypothetical protein n=1 Tax=unclassified Bosea (in: a-proteobacteria) TaxID=2653178 RepID=UPI00125C9AFE|nr:MULTISPECIES: hypothetical protein [unclassified Bosea (in: a-proteobacteria)]CAD5246541.1 conserved exported hypothetical protein [Bosea sp. 46]CAD5248448.1 conserved exported hypothetical protein [Bosea sp. 21B]CAD5267587.1 conserved exported hypothetical protein [Bosea sp. 7B]VVT45461.1 conserved exported hypothetical protein [Bosea sp. EC-HK365B]VXA94598.1 conserved exported hypothetical protein [Bosea sp. 29B]
MSKRSIVVVALGLALQGPAALAQSEGWGTGYQMGTSYAGVSGADGTRLTFYCGDAAAARANPAIASGPYLMAVLPKTQLKDALPSAVEIVADGKVTRVPVTAQAGIDEVELTWKPDGSFGAAQMKPVVAALRDAKRIELRAGDAAVLLPTEGVAKALADDPLQCP